LLALTQRLAAGAGALTVRPRADGGPATRPPPAQLAPVSCSRLIGPGPRRSRRCRPSACRARA